MSAINGNLAKGQNEDYVFEFRLTSSSSATDMALVKKIGIKMPSLATNDWKLAGTECIGRADS